MQYRPEARISPKPTSKTHFADSTWHKSVISSAGLSYNCAVPKKPDPPPRQFNVGDKIRVNMDAGQVVDAVVEAVISQTDGLRLPVDLGFNQTALIREWKVVKG